MAGFFTNLFDKITNMFKSKDLDSNISNFEAKMNQIIKDLIEPYANPTALASEDRFRDLLLLLDPKKCNKIAITLSNNLDKNYTKLQLEQFANNILVGKPIKDCNDDTCTDNSKPDINNKNSKVSKKEICNSIAVHYVKILNVICAILTAVNPADNICLNRLRNLITIMNEDTKEGLSGICSTTDNTVKNSIMHEPGFRELLLLYYYHLVQDTETNAEKANVRNQYQMLVQTFSNLVMFVDKSYKNKNNNNILIQKQLAKESKLESKLNQPEEEEEEPESEQNNPIKGEDNEISSYINNMRRENSMKNKNINNQEEPKQPAATSDNIANLRKNITNFKAEENQKLQRIINNIDGLSKIITEIQQRDTNKSTNKSTMNQPSSNQPSSNQPNNTSRSTLSNVTMNNIPNTNKNENENKNENKNENMPYTNVESTPNTTQSNQPMTIDQPNLTTSNNQSEESQPQQSNTITNTNTNTNTKNTVTPSESLQEPSSNTTPTVVSSNTITPPSTPVPAPVPAPAPAPSTANIPPVKNNNTSKNSLQSSTNNTGKAMQEINRLLKEYESEQPTQSGGVNNNVSRSGNSMTNNSITRKNNQNKNNQNKNENEEESIKEELEEEAENKRNEDLFANITNPNQTNQTNQTNQLNQSNINNTTINPYLQKFKEFVNLYNKVDKLDDKILEIVNTAFKPYNKFSSDNPNETNMYINPDEFDKFCKNNANQMMLIPIKLDDPRLGEFIKIYKDLKNIYLDNCEYLLKLLDDKILVQKTVDTGSQSASTSGNIDERPRFTLQNIGFNDLTAIETDVRNHLVTMYSQCHEYYQKAFVAIYKGLTITENQA